MIDRVALMNAIGSFVEEQWDYYKTQTAEKFPDLPDSLNIATFSPKDEELAIPFPIVSILPDNSPKEEYIGGKGGNIFECSVTMFQLSNYQGESNDILLHFANAMALNIPKRIKVTMFDPESSSDVEKPVMISLIDETYNLKSYGQESLLYSVEMKIRARL